VANHLRLLIGFLVFLGIAMLLASCAGAVNALDFGRSDPLVSLSWSLWPAALLVSGFLCLILARLMAK